MVDPNTKPSTNGATASWAMVIVNYGSHALLERNLRDAAAYGPGASVIVVDNRSSAEELQAVSALSDARGWTLVPSSANVGFGAGVNLGAAAAFERGCDVLLLVNPDAQVDASTAQALVQCCVDDPRTMVSPVIHDTDGAVVFRGADVGLRNGRIRGRGAVVETAHGNELGVRRVAEPAALWLTGACMAVHRSLFTEIGGFDGSYFLYWEDVDISHRAAQAGARLVVRTDLVVLHDEGGTHDAPRGRAKSRVYYFYNVRNRLLFAARHLSRAQRLRWILSTPMVSWEILMRGGRRQLLHSPRTLLSTITGSLSGVVMAITGRPRRAMLDAVDATSGDALVESDPPRSLTVAMLTFHRPDDLATVTPMLLAQLEDLDRHSQGRIRSELVIVDNDPQGSGAALLQVFPSDRVRCVVEPTPGITAARNRALDESSSDLLVFIDDDERPHPGWLCALVDARAASAASAVAGPVISEFVGELDPWVASGQFFTRRRMPTGTAIDVAATNNLLLDMRRVRADRLRFAPQFGLSGAEDTFFTRTLARSGATMVWCDEAVVTDVVPASRMTRDWVLRRAFSSGNSWSLTSVALCGNVFSRSAARVSSAGRGSLRVAGGAARLGVGVVTRSARQQTRGARTLARGLGMAVGSVGLAYLEYGSNRNRLRRVSRLGHDR